jgi:hypothetical protein
MATIGAITDCLELFGPEGRERFLTICRELVFVWRSEHSAQLASKLHEAMVAQPAFTGLASFSSTLDDIFSRPTIVFVAHLAHSIHQLLASSWCRGKVLARSDQLSTSH